MFWSIINENDILFDEKSIEVTNTVRSSNPYDYLRKGYFVDNASMFGGENIVDYNSCFSSYRTSLSIHISDI
ncbi:MAG: hypothetical protein K2J59_01515 [Eubacterium sp.]|nr:hypothetical protein [Eubacterium sp.]